MVIQEMSQYEKQGHLGKLSSMTLIQLQELQSRQLNILSNIRFVDQLPDKGARIKAFLERINAAISAAEQVDAATEMMKKMAISTADSQEVQDQLKEVMNTAKTEVVYQVEDPKEKQNDGNEDIITVKDLEDIGETVDFEAYSKKRIDKDCKTDKIQQRTFKPYRTVKSTTVDDIPAQRQIKQDTLSTVVTSPASKNSNSVTLEPVSQDCSVSATSSPSATNNSDRTSIAQSQQSLSDIKPHSSNSTVTSDNSRHKDVSKSGRRLKYRYDDNLESALERAGHQYGQTKLISITDMKRLHDTNTKKLQKLQAEQAAQRLAQRFKVDASTIPTKINVEEFNPEGTFYRSQDSDDEEDNTENACLELD